MVRWARLASTVVALTVVVSVAWSAPASAAYSTQPTSTSWVPNAVVKSLARWGDVVYIGGTFTSLKDPVSGRVEARNRVAALDARTGALLPWNPGANGTVEALEVAPDGKTVYLGGGFTSLNGSPATRLAAVTAGGAPVAGWKASANSTVFDIEATATSLYVGGSFGSVHAKPRPRLAKLDRATGALVTGFDAMVGGGRVTTVESSEDGSSVLIGGAFTGVGGVAQAFVAQVSGDDGDLSPTWRPTVCDTCTLWDLAVGPGRVYAAVGGPGGRVVAWGAAGDGDTLWDRRADGNVQAIDVHDGVVYAGGHFGPTFSGQTRHQIAALDAARGTVLPYTVEFVGRDYPGIWDLVADADGLRIVGGFSIAGASARRFAVLPVAP